MTQKGKPNLRSLLIGVPLAGGILAAEILGPIWLNGAIVYVAFVMFSLVVSPGRRVLLVAALLCSLVIGNHLLTDMAAQQPWLVIAHCTTWISALGVTVFLILWREKSERERIRFFSNSLDLLCVAGTDGYLKRVNPAFEKALGYAARELTERPYLDFVHPDDKAKVQAELERLSTGIPTSNFESRLRCRNGTYRTIAWAWSPMADDRLYYANGRDKTEELLTAAALHMSEAHLRSNEDELRALTDKLITVQEEERRRLARELHDSLSQKIAVIAVEISGIMKQESTARDRTLAYLQELPDQLGDLAEYVRSMSHQLHPSILDNVGLMAALKNECEHFSRREGIAIYFRSENVPERLPENLSLCLYRITQECLSNIAKHACSPHGFVAIAVVDNHVLLSIADSGVGFDQAVSKGKPGLGLISIRERVRLIHGKLSITSSPGRGTEIEVEAPLKKENYETTEDNTG